MYFLRKGFYFYFLTALYPAFNFSSKPLFKAAIEVLNEVLESLLLILTSNNH